MLSLLERTALNFMSVMLAFGFSQFVTVSREDCIFSILGNFTIERKKFGQRV